MRGDIHILRGATGLVLALALLGTTAHPAPAALLNWVNAAGGSAATASNWSPAQVPTTSDNLVYALDTGYTVTYGLVLNQTFNNRIREGAVVFSYSSPHTMTGPLEIGACCADSARLSIPTGSVTVNAQIEIGDDSGANGRLVLSDNDVNIVKTGAGNVLVGGGPTSGGLGRLDLSGGAVLDIQLGDLSIGHNAAPADGRVFVSGRSFDTPFRSSALRVTGGFGNDIVVGNQGAGSLTVDAGGFVRTDASILMAQGTGSVAGVTVKSSGFGSALEAGEDLTIAGAGTGVLNVLAGGAVTVGDLTRLTSGTGTGTLHIETGGIFTTRRFEYSTGGFLLHDGGLLRVDGGDVDLDGRVLVITSTGGLPVLELSNGATMVLPSSSGDALLIGREGQGQLSLLSGSSCALTIFGATLGRDAGSSGTLLVDGGSTFAAPGTVSAGVNGAAQINVQGGGQLDAQSIHLGAAATGSGALDVLGAGSRVDVSSLISVGGAGGAAQGDGFLTISDGGAVHVANAGSNSTRIWNGGGVLNIYNGGSLTSAGGIDHRGVIQLGAGTLTAATLDFAGAATLTGSGTVAARIVADDPAGVITASGGSLMLGTAADTAGFASVGSLHVGAETVRLLDADGPLLGNVTIDGGNLVYAGTGTLASGKLLTGEGLVDGEVANAGAITAQGTGLRFGELVTMSNPSATIAGTLVQFLHDGGGFTGRGTLDCRVDGDARSVITATGPLTMGSLSSPAGVVLDGELHVGFHSVILLDPDGIDLGSLTTLAGGALHYAGELRLGPGDDLTGTGGVNASLRNNGLITPGFSAGIITVGGNYVNSLFGVLEAELGNHAIFENDQLRVFGTALLEGGTLDVKALPAFNADIGDEFAVLTAASVSGTFGFVTFTGFPAGTQFEVVYNPTSVVVRVTGSAGIEAPLAAPEALPVALAFRAMTAPDGAAAFELALPSAAGVNVSLYDIAGRQVARLHDGRLAPGWHRLAVPQARLARGIYFGRSEIATDGQRETRTARVVLVK